MIKVRVKKFIKSVGLLSVAERINYHRIRRQNLVKNKEFKEKNPDIVLPPDFFMYETFSLDYHKFYYGGLETADWLLEHLKKHITLENVKILDWGCGSGRILRHLPSLLNKSNEVFGTDYNLEYTKWCKENLKNVRVSNNGLHPKLKFEDSFFDVIYGISIFTHLSKKMHEGWLTELSRILKKDSLLFLTLHGEVFKEKLTKEDCLKFDNGEIIEHGYKVEGNRLFVAYQPYKYFMDLSSYNSLELLEHIPGKIKNNKPQQDVWILRKK